MVQRMPKHKQAAIRPNHTRTVAKPYQESYQTMPVQLPKIPDRDWVVMLAVDGWLLLVASRRIDIQIFCTCTVHTFTYSTYTRIATSIKQQFLALKHDQLSQKLSRVPSSGCPLQGLWRVPSSGCPLQGLSRVPSSGCRLPMRFKRTSLTQCIVITSIC